MIQATTELSLSHAWAQFYIFKNDFQASLNHRANACSCLFNEINDFLQAL
jgi:hypothetical protein